MFDSFQASQPPAPLPVEQGPLAGFSAQYQQVMTGAIPADRRHVAVEDAAIGAAAGFGAWLVWQRAKFRKARVGQYTTLVVRAQFLWWALFTVVLFAQGIWRSWWVVGGGFALDSVAATAYLIHNKGRVARQGRH